MSEKEQAYTIKVDQENRQVVIVANAGIIGPFANQLKDTSDKRKAHTILRRLGHDLSAAGNQLYGKVTNDKR